VQIGLLNRDNLPVVGVAEARKVTDQNLPSNALMRNWANSDGKPI
jgi:carboxymethylenebutenolidase